jgi:SPP1 family predicted phage head-tail adaptor
MGDEIGDMRERVLIQKRVETPNAIGGAAEAWTDVTTVWARIMPISDSETVRSMTLAQGVTYKVRIRWRDDLGTLDDERYRMVWNSTVMRIVGRQNPDAKKRFIEITARIGQDDPT